MPEKQYFTGIDVINAPRIESLTVTEDGTYTASSDVIGYNPVVVNTNHPWEPLEDGYSNFWFELTNDTLSPWLNFSAKDNDAVIDWGDGSGEVALDTLTPTHTYSKAGKYVVKVKGVTGIDQLFSAPYTYNYVLIYAELNNEVTSLAARAFNACFELKRLILNATTSFGAECIKYCSNLEEIIFPTAFTGTINTDCCRYDFRITSISLGNASSLGSNAFLQCLSLEKITLPPTVSNIGASCFSGCVSLSEIHVQATTPPALGTNAFSNLLSTYVIYVPVGTLSAYQTAWSTYADHIVEEGQTPNRAMLSRLAVNDDDTDEEMR